MVTAATPIAAAALSGDDVLMDFFWNVNLFFGTASPF
jgi:hypothetical protein